MTDVREFRPGVRLTLVDGDGPAAVTGDQVLKEGARLLGDYFQAQLPAIPLADPCRHQIEAHLALYMAVGALTDRGA